ncbi:MAG: TIGR03086 family protein [Dehalococcoidia bacterium]|nr:TIGR03086 family protein [Dehalococcoidia bacterium]
MTQQAANPIELCDAAVKRARGPLAGVKSNQLGGSTPCAEWNVQQLMDHFTDAASYGVSVLTGTKPAQAAGKTALERFESALAGLLMAAKAPGTLGKQVQGPIGPMPGAAMVMTVTNDMTIHGWDLAKATGQDTKIEQKLLQAAYDMYKNNPPGGNPPFFAAQPAVPANADFQTKVLAIMRRKA